MDNKINEINNIIEFMNNKHVFHKCKLLKSEPSAEQFITANCDEGTMTSAHQVLTDNMSDDQIMAELKRHTEVHGKSKDKDKMFNK